MKSMLKSYYRITLINIKSLNQLSFFLMAKKKVIDSFRLTSPNLRNQDFKVSSGLGSFPSPVNTSGFVDVSLGPYVLEKWQP